MHDVAHKIDHLEKVAASFVCQFYSKLAHAPESLAHWYGKDSFVSYGDVTFGDEFLRATPVLGGEHINERLRKFAEEIRGSQIKILQVDNQPAFGNSTLVSVWGLMSHGATKRHFYHVVTLSPSEEDEQSSFFIRNDTFRFLPATTVENVVTTPEVAVVEAPVAPAVAEPIVHATPEPEPAAIEAPQPEEQPQEKKKSRNKGKQPPKHHYEPEGVVEEHRVVTPPAEPAHVEESTATESHAVNGSAHDDAAHKPAAPKSFSYAAIALAAKDKRPVPTQPTRIGGGAAEPEPEQLAPAHPVKNTRVPPACVVVLKKFPRTPTDDEIRAALGKIASKCTKIDNNVEAKGVAFLEFSVPDALDVLSKQGVQIDGYSVTVEARKPKN